MQGLYPLSFIILFLSSNIVSLGNGNTTHRQQDDFLPGYIITLNNDTIRGLILVKDHFFNAKSCVFKESRDSALKTYTPDELTAYAIGNEKYFYSDIVNPGVSTQKVFLECIVKGKVSLFFFQDRYFLKTRTRTEELVLVKSNLTEGGKVYTRDLPIYKSILQTGMNDCSNIHQNIKETAFTRKDLTQLIIDYHTCIGYDAVLFESISEKIRIRYGLSLGIFVSTLAINSGGDPSLLYLDDKKAKDNCFAPSFLVEFSRPGTKNKIRLRTGLTYYNTQYAIYDENVVANLDHELTIKNSRIEIPLLLKYYFLKGGKGVYVLGGLGLNGSVKWEDKEIVKVPPSYILSESSSLENNSFFTNILAGLGFDFSLGNRSFFAETSYGRSQSVLSSAKGPTGTLNAFTFSAGILF